MTARCPSDLALEGLLLEPDRSPVAGHVAGCPRCGERLARMRAEGEEFARTVLPATVEAVAAAASRRPWWRRPFVLLPAPLLAAAAAALLLVRTAGPPADYLGVKGGAGEVGLTIFTPGANGVAPVRDGQPVPPSAQVRFQVRAPPGCHLWIASIDGSGAVSRLFPAAGEAAPLGAREAQLPGGALLDGAPGPERIYALCTPGPSPWSAVEQALRPGAPGAEGVRHPAPPRALPAGASWSSVLLEKRP